MRDAVHRRAGLWYDKRAMGMPPSPTRVLVVDDEERFCALTCALFKERGYEVASACTSAEALALVEQFRPDVILLDIVMPGLSGLELLRAVRDRPFPPRVIMVTASPGDDVAQQAVREGAEAFVCKPVDFNTLERLVCRIWPSTQGPPDPT